MAPNSATIPTTSQASPQVSLQLQQRLTDFVKPLLRTLDQELDVRLVRTFLATLIVILQWRNRAHGLLLSELGAYLRSPKHAPAATKRLSNLLRSDRWAADIIAQFLWTLAKERVRSLLAQQERPLLIWDESVLEKSESLKSEGLCAVRSSKARRLKRIRPGFFNPPAGRPICVAGLHWLGLLVAGRSGAPTLAALQWWTTRGPRATTQSALVKALLERCKQQWGGRVWHIFDRGYASGPWLQTFLSTRIQFVLRWKKGQKLLDSWGEERKAWEIARGKRAWGYRQLRDARSGQTRKVGVLAFSVTHPSHAQPLWLVVARLGKGQEPWYLLTTQRVERAEQAWEVVFAYARRWQIEVVWRYCKSELAMESPRVWTWERREKLLLMATLVYAFLLSLLDEQLQELRDWLLRFWCHRTGKRSRQTSAPLYRLRSAISRLWQEFLPSPLTQPLSLG